MNFRVALLQVAAFGNDQSRNLQKGLRCCRDAKFAGADLAVFPELWNIGGTPCPLDEAGRRLWMASAIDRQSDFFQKFAALADELGMNIALTYLETHHPKPRNTVSIIDRQGEVVLNYSKVFICNFGEHELRKPNPDVHEIACDMNCSAGESFDVCTLAGTDGPLCVGAMICSDREFPEAATQLMLKGAELIVVPNACTWGEIRTAGLKTRAFENLLGVAMANYPGASYGNSQAYSSAAWKNGKARDTLVARAGTEEEILIANLDIDEIRTFRKAESWRILYRRRSPSQ